jgi:hypothetical protein
MSKLTRDDIQEWLDQMNVDSSICPDCEGIHLPVWEERDGVLEARCFVEKDRVYLMTEIAIRPSAVLPLQGAVHFMNYDYGFLKVMIAMADHDVPRLLLTHAMPSKHLVADQFQQWLKELFKEKEAVFKHLQEMDVILTDDMDMLTDFDDQLH